MRCYHCGAGSIWVEHDGRLVCLLCSRVQNLIEPEPRKEETRGGYNPRKGVINK